MNNNIIKLICIVLSVATACLSAILTTKFMFSIGQDMGSPILMAALGLLLDLAKCATPLFVLFLWSQKMRLTSIFALVLSMTLSAVSFSASVAALESGVTANAQNSVSYQRIESQITDYRDQVIELRQLAKRQQAAKQITKSQNTLSQIPTLLTSAKYECATD
jgi:ABC-type bacteriocin/lantibiotic exporter with double-glycine peptidase domain